MNREEKSSRQRSQDLPLAVTTNTVGIYRTGRTSDKDGISSGAGHQPNASRHLVPFSLATPG